MKRLLFLVEAARPARVEEALRAALGASLRGGAIEVVLPADRPRTPLARRAVAVLETFGHAVREADEAGAVARAEVIEVWTDTPGSSEADAEAEADPEAHAEAKTQADADAEAEADPEAHAEAEAEPASGAAPTLHLLRVGARPPPHLLAASDWLVALAGGPRLLPRGAPPLPAGPLSFEELHRLLALAARVVTW